jgi:hypothetical protein
MYSIVDIFIIILEFFCQGASDPGRIGGIATFQKFSCTMSARLMTVPGSYVYSMAFLSVRLTKKKNKTKSAYWNSHCGGANPVKEKEKKERGEA